MGLHAQVVPISDISPTRRDAMYRLMERYYAGVRRDAFEDDLSHKDWVIQIEDGKTKSLCGFSSQVVWNVTTQSREARVLFSGDTIIDHQFWGNNPLAQTWGQFALSLIDACDQQQLPLYWFLIVKGYKTYRFLPLFFRIFYPRFDARSPDWEQHLIHQLGSGNFPKQYNATTGVIHAAVDGCRLRTGVADITATRLRDPHVRFFAAHNPGHIAGDELCCIAPLTRDNFTGAARRVIGKHRFVAATRA